MFVLQVGDDWQELGRNGLSDGSLSMHQPDDRVQPLQSTEKVISRKKILINICNMFFFTQQRNLLFKELPRVIKNGKINFVQKNLQRLFIQKHELNIFNDVKFHQKLSL